jgi:hypothetical protein
VGDGRGRERKEEVGRGRERKGGWGKGGDNGSEAYLDMRDSVPVCRILDSQFRGQVFQKITCVLLSGPKAFGHCLESSHDPLFFWIGCLKDLILWKNHERRDQRKEGGWKGDGDGDGERWEELDGRKWTGMKKRR